MLAFRTVQQSNHCAREEFLYELKAGLRAAASGGRPRPPTTATGNQRNRGLPQTARIRGTLILHTKLQAYLCQESRSRNINISIVPNPRTCGSTDYQNWHTLELPD